MNTSIKTHAAAIVGSILVTFAMVDMVANYALPDAPVVVIATASP